MRQNTNAEVFKGTVSELAGKMTGPSGEVLNVQDVQFLTRIGNGTFAKKIGTAPGTGTRGGKRAIVWEINPTARLVLGVAANETPAKSEKSRASAKPEQSSSQSVEALVAAALAKHGIKAPAKRTRRTKAEMEAARAAEAAAAAKAAAKSKGKGRAKAEVSTAVKVGRKPKAK